ncbi:MAG: hypothetical protein C4325_08240 [Blastocatellia bacterium]
MKKSLTFAIYFSFFAISLATLTISSFGQRAADRQTRDLVRTLDSQVDDVRFAIEYDVKANSAGVDRNSLVRSLDNLRQKIALFSDNFLARRENRDDINAIITAAKDVDAALKRGNTNRKIETDWAEIKRTIESLAGKYGVVPNWTSRTSNATAVIANATLTGTYRLDSARSERVADIVAASKTDGENRRDLESKLEAPEIIAIDVRGNQVTLASSIASPVTFLADGREKIERDKDRTIRLRATLRGQQLVVSSLGGETDYTITFALVDGGRALRVTRRITTDYLPETIFAESIYTRTDSVADLNIAASNRSQDYSSSDPADSVSGSPQSGRPSIIQGRGGRFLIPNGTVLTALLESTIDTQVSQNNDRFKMTVQSPIEYRGAVIEGFLSGIGRSGRVSGNANVTFNFETITLRNGERYEFAGILQAVKDHNGKVIKVDAEGTAKSDSQTKETVKRGGIGAGVGAVIGAIAGGGKGAVIGAVIGGGAGAGSVIATGRDDIKILPGAMFTIQATAPSTSQSEN